MATVQKFTLKKNWIIYARFLWLLYVVPEWVILGFVTVLLSGFKGLGRIYFCSHSNQRKTNLTWFLFQHYIVLFGNKTLNSILWSLSALISILPISSFFHTGNRLMPTYPLKKVELALSCRGKEHSWRSGGLVKQGGSLEKPHMVGRLDCITVLQSVHCIARKGTGSDYSP